MAGRAKVPAAARIAKVVVAGQDARATVEGDDRVFDMHMIDAVGEGADKLDWINALPDQMAGVEVEAEFFAMDSTMRSARSTAAAPSSPLTARPEPVPPAFRTESISPSSMR